MSQFAAYFDQKRGVIRRQRSAITDALNEGSTKISEISKLTDLDKMLVLWNLLSMMRWGAVEVVGHDNDELVFSLKEV